MKILFACDLDSTLIHSHRSMREGDICVERYAQKDQAFISPLGYELLEEIQKYVTFVPITTRSIEQYQRIIWHGQTRPKYALTTNGSVLFEDENPDELWNEYYKSYSANYMEEYQKLIKIFDKQDRFKCSKVINDRYLYCHFKPEVDIDECISEYYNCTELDVLLHGRKLYFLPKEVCKGVAVEKLKKKLNADVLICAGDSIMDTPMFKHADIAYSPSEDLVKDFEYSQKDRIFCCEKDVLFSEFILKDILEKVIKLVNDIN